MASNANLIPFFDPPYSPIYANPLLECFTEDHFRIYHLRNYTLEHQHLVDQKQQEVLAIQFPRGATTSDLRGRVAKILELSPEHIKIDKLFIESFVDSGSFIPQSCYLIGGGPLLEGSILPKDRLRGLRNEFAGKPPTGHEALYKVTVSIFSCQDKTHCAKGISVTILSKPIIEGVFRIQESEQETLGDLKKKISAEYFPTIDLQHIQFHILHNAGNLSDESLLSSIDEFVRIYVQLNEHAV
jgi:hypothetical protein